MGTVNPRSRGNRTLSSLRAGDRRDREQLRRLVTRVPKQKTAFTGGGIIGQLEVYAEDGFNIPPGEDIDTGGELVWRKFEATTIQGDTSWFQSGAGTPDELWLDEGWYGVTVGTHMFWPTEAGAPDSFRLYINGGWDSPPLDGSTKPRTHLGSSLWGIASYWNYGPSYIREPVFVQMRTEGTPPSTAHSYSNLYMVITRYA